MAKYRIIHYKKECIGCGACAAVAPEFWSMDDEGLAHLKNAQKVDDHWELKIDSEDAKETNQEAVDVCPNGVIQIKKED